MLERSVSRKKWIVDTGKTYVLAWNQFMKKNICRLDGFHWTGRCIGLVGRRRMKDERLEMLSDRVRRGIPVDFSEAIEVIDYQQRLQQERKNNSWMNRVRRFFGFKS